MRHIDYFYEIITDLNHIYHLSISRDKLSTAVRAKELIARITGVLVRPETRDKGKKLTLASLTEEQINSLIADAHQLTNDSASEGDNHGETKKNRDEEPS